MSYIVKTISAEDYNELKRINEILKLFFLNKDKNKADEFIEKLEEKGYVICKKVLIDN